jgi:hypothetical protein
MDLTSFASFTFITSPTSLVFKKQKRKENFEEVTWNSQNVKNKLKKIKNKNLF